MRAGKGKIVHEDEKPIEFGNKQEKGGMIINLFK